MASRFFAVVVSLALVASHGAQQAAGEDFDGTPAEKELIALLDSIDERYAAFREEADVLKDANQQIGFREKNDPAHECVPRLLAFEEQHRGTLAGLMAIRKIVSLAGKGGHVDNPRARGRREVLDRLSTYVDKSEIISILGRLRNGTYEPRVADILRTIAEDEGAAPLGAPQK